MKFSTKDRYALRVMVDLANHGNGGFVPLKEISDRNGISLKYLEQIVTPLARSGLVASGRGAQGGYRLMKEPKDYTAGEILRAVEGELLAIPCLGTDAAECPHRPECRTQGFWEGLNDVINRYVDGVTLEQISLRQKTCGDTL